MISLVVISYAALFFIGTVCFLWDKGTEEDLKERRIKVINRRNSKDNVYNELDEGFFNRFVKPLIGRAKQSVEDASNKSSSKNASNEAKMEQVARRIRLAGLKIQPVDFLFIKRAALIIGAILGVLLGLLLCLLQQQYGIVSLGDADGSFIVDAYPVSVHYIDVLGVFVTVVIIGFISSLVTLHIRKHG